jgi:hypothetical protein
VARESQIRRRPGGEQFLEMRMQVAKNSTSDEFFNARQFSREGQAGAWQAHPLEPKGSARWMSNHWTLDHHLLIKKHPPKGANQPEGFRRWQRRL